MIDKLKRLVYLGGIYSIGSVFEAVLTFLFIPIYTAYLGTSDYGIVGLMSITVGMTITLIGPPINSGFVRYYYSPSYERKRGLLLFNTLLLLTVLTLTLAALFYLIRGTISATVLGDTNLDFIYIVKLYALILLFQPISEFLLLYLKQTERARLFVLISWAKFLISSGVILSGLLYLKFGVLALIYGNLAGVVLPVILILPSFLKRCTPKISLSVLAPPLRYGYPRILSAFSMLLLQAGDRYVLQYLSSLSVVGLYSFGYTIAGIIQVMLNAPLKDALHPLAFQQEKTPQQQKDFLRTSCTYFYIVGLLFCLTLSLYSKELIELMARKEEFWAGWVIVPVIAFSYVLHGLGNFFDWGQMMTNKSIQMSANVMIAAIVNIALNFALIPQWGIMGAALATLASYLVWNGLKLYYSAKFYDLHFDLYRIGHITLVGVGLFLLSLFIATTDNYAFNLAIKFVLLLAYAPLLFFTGLFSTAERKHLAELWHSLRINGLKATYKMIRSL